MTYHYKFSLRKKIVVLFRKYYDYDRNIIFIINTKMENLASEILFKILLDTQYRDLVSYYSTNNSIYNRCQDEYFWKLKLDCDYPNLRQYKAVNLTYQQQYASLYNLPSTGIAIVNGRLDQIILLHKNYQIAEPEELNIAVANGAIDILNYYANNTNVLPNEDAYYYAAGKQHIAILDWLYFKNISIPYELFVDDIANNFISTLIKDLNISVLPVLLWFEEHGIPIDDWIANNSVFYDNIQLLTWLQTNHNMLANASETNLTDAKGNIEVLPLASVSILPDNDDLTELVDVETYIWLRSYYQPTPEWAIYCILNRNTTVADWLTTKSIGYNEISDWIKNKHNENMTLNC